MLPILRTDNALTPAWSRPINRLESLFDEFFGDDGGSLTRAFAGIPMAMWQDDDKVYVEADLPGLTDKDVEVTVHDGMLFIRGERTCEPPRGAMYDGRCYGRFERAIRLPEAVDTDAVEAGLSNGVLRVALPKRPEAKPKRIELKSS